MYKLKKLQISVSNTREGFINSLISYSYILAEGLHFNNSSMQKYALGPLQVIKAVDGDTGSFCCYTQHLLIFWQVFVKIPGVGGHPQHLGWVPGGRGTLWVCSWVINVT